MTTFVSKSQFKARALELFREIEASGESMIVTDHGKPTLEVRKLSPDMRDPFEILKGSVMWYHRPLDPAVDEDDWEVLR